MGTLKNKKSMSKTLGQFHEFAMKLQQAGFQDEWFQKIISSKDNKLAEEIAKLVSGDYELVQKSPLVKKEQLIIEAFSGAQIALFNRNKTGKNKQDYHQEFENLLYSIDFYVKTPAIKVQSYVLKQGVSDYNVQDIIGLEKMIHKSPIAALVTLYSTMIDKYRDDYINTVYFLNEIDQLYFASTSWHEKYKEWFCWSGSIVSGSQSANRRIFCPV